MILNSKIDFNSFDFLVELKTVLKLNGHLKVLQKTKQET
jgi:hypothetical protein